MESFETKARRDKSKRRNYLQMSEQTALIELRGVKDAYRRFIVDNFEFAAKDCGACETFGACCVDAHFVNVHITRLEAAAILKTLAEKLTTGELQKINERIAQTIEKYSLTESGETFARTFACPLFEPNIGCLVHGEAKPAACISHACYERPENLPPQCLQDHVERKIEKLNREIYDEDWRWLPLPLQLKSQNAER